MSPWTRIRRWIVIRSPEYQSVLAKLAEAEKKLASVPIFTGTFAEWRSQRLKVPSAKRPSEEG